MNLFYVAPDIPISHTGDFVGGSTHVLKVAESLAKKGNNAFILIKKSLKRAEEIREGC